MKLLLPILCCGLLFSIATGQQRFLPIIIDGKCGFIDTSGEVTITPQFVEQHPFSNGYSLVGRSLGQWSANGPNVDITSGYVNLKGEFKEVDGFDLLGSFHEGLAKGRRPGMGAFTRSLWGFIDTTLSVSVKPDYYDVGNFSEGLAWVESKEMFLFFVISDTYGYINRDGTLVIPSQFDRAGNFSGGLANVTINGKKGFINHKGQVVIAPYYEQVNSFSMGLAAVKLNGKWGFIDTMGTVVIEPKYEAVQSFTEGLAPVKLSGRWGFINQFGKFVVAPSFDEVLVFSEGLASVLVSGKWGYIDSNGTIQIEPKFDYVSPFYNHIASVELGGKMGYINRQGKYIWKPTK